MLSVRWRKSTFAKPFFQGWVNNMWLLFCCVIRILLFMSSFLTTYQTWEIYGCGLLVFSQQTSLLSCQWNVYDLFLRVFPCWKRQTTSNKHSYFISWCRSEYLIVKQVLSNLTRCIISLIVDLYDGCSIVSTFVVQHVCCGLCSIHRHICLWFYLSLYLHR